MADFKQLLENNFPKEKLFYNEPMKKHTSFKVGGFADIFACPSEISEIVFLIEACRESGMPYYIIGNGSNLLVKDNGIRGVVIQLFKSFSNISLLTEEKIKAQSGALLSLVSNFALNNELSGMEPLSGIPGTIGGAVSMNAGAYDGEIKDIIEEVSVYDNSTVRVYKNNELDFSYRTSKIQKNNLCVLEAVISLKKGDKEEIKEKMLRLNQLRNEKQPVDKPSAGSTFKRPEGFFAGKLIMDSGLRGFKIGGAKVSDKHCGFIINDGGAAASDILNLIDHVKNTVFKKYGVLLEEEVRVIGE